MSTTTNLKLFKHDNPSTNTNEFNVDTALNQNWDKIDNFVGTVNGKILEIQNKDTEQDEKISSMQSEIEVIQEKDNVQDTKLAELQAENERLRKDINGLPSGQATAETIYLTDSAEMRFKKFGISGNSAQETRSGKNVFNNTKTPDKLIGATATTIETGVRITSTGEGTWRGVIYVIKDLSNYVGKVVRVKSTMTPNGENQCYLVIGICSSSGDNRTTLADRKISGEANFIIPEFTDSNTYLFITLNSNSTGTGVEGSYVDYTNLIITIDNEDTSYEPYGAMPSTYYPSEVKSCGDNINILENIATSQEVNGLTVEVNDDKTVTINGTATQITDITIGYVDFKTNINYVLSGTKNGETNKWFLSIRGYGNDIGNGLSYTPTENTTKEIFIRVYEGITLNNQIFKPKVEKGSKATPYSPYGQGCINEVICNKNLANIEEFNIAGGSGSTYPKIIQGLKENTEYTLSFYKSRIAGATISNKAIHGCRQMHFYHNEEKLSEYIYHSPVSGFSSGNKKFEIKITTPAKCNKVICYFDNANGDNNINTTIYDIQLEEGSATDYIPHEEQNYPIPTQQPMRAVGDIRDTFIKKNNKWYERHYIVKTTLGGTESWSSWNISGQTKTKAYVIRNFYGVIGETNINAGCPYLSDYFLFNENNDYNNDEELLFINENNALGIRIKTENGSDLTTFKNWLSNHNIPVYFISKNPADIECTPEQNEILDKIEQEAHTYKNVTHIYSTDEVSSVNSIEYIKDIETLINKATAVAE